MKCLFIEAILEIRFLLYFYSLKQTAIAETTETRNSYDFNGRNVLMLRKKTADIATMQEKKSNLPFKIVKVKNQKATVFLICGKTFDFATCSSLFTSRVSPINFKQFN